MIFNLPQLKTVFRGTFDICEKKFKKREYVFQMFQKIVAEAAP